MDKEPQACGCSRVRGCWAEENRGQALGVILEPPWLLSKYVIQSRKSSVEGHHFLAVICSIRLLGTMF